MRFVEPRKIFLAFFCAFLILCELFICRLHDGFAFALRPTHPILAPCVGRMLQLQNGMANPSSHLVM